MTSDEQVFSYDELPYSGHVHMHAHPRRIGAMAKLFGLEVAELNVARVLDIGCGQGDDLLPLASAYPSAQFVGIDLGERHIENARSIASRRGLANVEFIQMDLTELASGMGQFDYVIAHGVYSWVPPFVADSLLSVCSSLLTNCGVAYISYNVLPGWRPMQRARDEIRAHVVGSSTAAGQVAAAKAYIQERIADSESGWPTAKTLRVIASRLEASSDSYFFHEFLCDDNHPARIREFVSRAKQHDLLYIGDVKHEAMWGDGVSEHVAAEAASFAGDRVAREEFLDEMTGLQFRHSLLCRADLSVSPDPLISSLPALAFSTRLTERGGGSFADSSGRSVVVTGEGTIAAMSAIAGGGGRPIPYNAAWDKAGSGGEVCNDLLMLARAGLIELALPNTQCAERVETYPRVIDHARAEVAEGASRTVGLGHRTLELDPVSRLLVSVLDGTRDRHDLARELTGAYARGDIPYATLGGGAPSPELLLPTIDAWLEQALALELLLANCDSLSK